MIQPHQWLVKRDGKWGCLICSTACKKDALDGRPMEKWRYVAFARYDVVHLKIGNVRRHEKCRAHRAAMQALGLSPADIQDDDDDAPTIEAIMSFWQSRKNGSSLATVSEVSRDVRNGGKHRRLEWCIAETRRCVFRMFIENWTAGSVTLMQDGRGKHLQVRVCACDERLEVVSTTMSFIETHGEGGLK